MAPSSLAEVFRAIRELPVRRSLKEWLLGRAAEAAAIASVVEPSPVVVPAARATSDVFGDFEAALWAVAEVKGTLTKPSAGDAKAWLSSHSDTGALLAARLSRTSKGRNRSAHPDPELAAAIRRLGSVVDARRGDPDHVGPDALGFHTVSFAALPAASTHVEAVPTPSAQTTPALSVPNADTDAAPDEAEGSRRRRRPRKPVRDADDAILEAAVRKVKDEPVTPAAPALDEATAEADQIGLALSTALEALRQLAPQPPGGSDVFSGVHTFGQRSLPASIPASHKPSLLYPCVRCAVEFPIEQLERDDKVDDYLCWWCRAPSHARTSWSSSAWGQHGASGHRSGGRPW